MNFYPFYDAAKIMKFMFPNEGVLKNFLIFILKFYSLCNSTFLPKL